MGGAGHRRRAGAGAAGVRLATCWDVAAVHRLLFGGWRAEPGVRLGLPARAGAGGHARRHGRARPVQRGRGLADAPALGAAAALAGGTAAAGQPRRRRRRTRLGTARAESTAELLCAELSADGLPVDRAAAEELLAGHHRAPAARARPTRRPSARRGTSGCCGTRPPRRGPPTCAARAGEVAARGGRDRRARHPRVAAGGVQGPLAAGRGAAGVAQGGADRHHLRLRLAGRAPRRRRAAARRVDRRPTARPGG